MRSVFSLSDFNQNQKVNTTFSTNSKLEILRKSLWWGFLFHADAKMGSDVEKAVLVFSSLTCLKTGSGGNVICENNMDFIWLITHR